jgi:hypothetical protein
MEFKETKIIKTFFVLEKKEFGFSPKDRTKNQILFSNRRLMPMHSKKPKPAATTATHLPLQFSPLSLEKKKTKTKTQPLNQLPIKPPNHGIAVNNETIQLPGAGKKKEHEKRKLRQTQAITTANATVQAHTASNSTRAGRPAKTKVKAKEGRKTG